jgi:site-specific recombinase XerD
LPYEFLFTVHKTREKAPCCFSKEEVWAMLKNAKLLKHRILIGLLYGCGLRCMEARSVRLQDLI